MCEVVDCQPSSSPDGGEGRFEEEEESEVHSMTAVQLAAFEAVNGRHFPGQMMASQAPVVKQKMRSRAEEEEEVDSSFSGLGHGQSVVETVKVEGDEEEPAPVEGAGNVRTTACSNHLDTPTESMSEDHTGEASSQMTIGVTANPDPDPMLIPLGQEVKETRVRTRKRKRVQMALKQLSQTRFHVADANSITLSMCDYQPSPPPPVPLQLPAPLSASYAGKKPPYILPPSKTGKRVVAISCEMEACLQVNLDWWAKNKHAAIEKAASLRGVRKKGNRKHQKMKSPAYCEVPMISRYTIVDYNGEVIYDKFISTERHVWIRHKKKRKFVDYGTPLASRSLEIGNIVKGCIVVGHGITSNLVALEQKFPVDQIRDTSLYAPLQGMAGLDEASSPPLKSLAQVLLEWESLDWRSLETARASMELYKLVEVHWEGHEGHTLPARGEGHGGHTHQ